VVQALPALVVLMLLLAAPAYGAGSLKMSCPRCDHVDVDGHGRKANATLILVVRDVRSGQEVVPETGITAHGSGSLAGGGAGEQVARPRQLLGAADEAPDRHVLRHAASMPVAVRRS
jgi:hypothetical protein